MLGLLVAVDPATTQPWQSLEANTPGNAPIGVPILVTQGDADELVLPAATKDFVGKLCATGEHVEYHRTAASTTG